MKRILTAAFIALALPGAASAGQHQPQQPTQLELQVQQRIAQYGIRADLTGINLTALVQLKGVVESRDGYLEKRRKILFILKNNGYAV